MSRILLSRRRLLLGTAAASGSLLLGGCDQLSQNQGVLDVLGWGERASLGAQRLALSGGQLAHEFTDGDLSPVFRANGTTMPDGEAYARLLANRFADWRLEVTGLVAKPLSLSLADLRALPARTQITRHDCVEGWSAIGKWTGVPLAELLRRVEPKPAARYAVFRCADTYEETSDGTGVYYESIDMVDAWHPQTILAYAMNGADLPVAHGAPLRLRVERQLGYKHAKYVMRVELVDSFARIGRGNGGFWEDRGYEWYAGI